MAWPAGPGGNSIPDAGNASHRHNPQNRVQLIRGERLIAYRHRAEHLRVELDLIERDTVGDAKIEMLPHPRPPPSPSGLAEPLATRLRRGRTPPHDPSGSFTGPPSRGILPSAPVTIPRSCARRETGCGKAPIAFHSRLTCEFAPDCGPVPPGAGHVTGGCIGERVAVLIGQVAHDPAWHAGHQDSGRDLLARPQHRARRHQ